MCPHDYLEELQKISVVFNNHDYGGALQYCRKRKNERITITTKYPIYLEINSNLREKIY